MALAKDAPAKPRLPRVFIASSNESRVYAVALQANLGGAVEATVWNQGVFGPGLSTLESLIEAAKSYDFAVLVLMPEDVLTKRRVRKYSPRDNVLFELGLFMGILGRERSLMVVPREPSLHLPNDLAGITQGRFDKDRQDKNWRAALGPASSDIEQTIARLGIRDEGIPQELRLPFAERQAGLSSNQVLLLRILQDLGLDGDWGDQKEISERFAERTGGPIAEELMYYRLEQLRLLGFIERQPPGAQGGYRYRFSDGYRPKPPVMSAAAARSK
jgi:hypothetical protein